MARLLVVDDEPRIARFVSRALSAEGWSVDVADNGAAAVEAVRTGRFDLVVLDLMLPGLDGFGVLEVLAAERPDQRVLVLSAIGDVAARVRCLDLGAADYLPKPFAVAELVARVRARLREATPTRREDERVLRAGRASLDVRRRVLQVDGRRVYLSEREFMLLLHLMRRAGEVCSREELLSEVWGYSYDPGSNVVDVCVARLRSKVSGGLIETVRNVGYSFLAA